MSLNDEIFSKREMLNKKLPIVPFIFVVNDDRIKRNLFVIQSAVLFRVLDRRGNRVLCKPNAADDGLYSEEWPVDSYFIEGEAKLYQMSTERYGEKINGKS